MKRLQTKVLKGKENRVDLFLRDWIPVTLGVPVSATFIRKMIMAGAVFVNRKKVLQPHLPLYQGAYVEVFWNETLFERHQSTQNQILEPDQSAVSETMIRYEDDDLLVIDKPAGLPTQPTVDPNRKNLFSETKALLERRKTSLKEPYLGLHHRLDRDTSGLVLFTKSERANKGVSDLFREHQIEKHYHCIVWKGTEHAVNDRFTLETFHGKVSKPNENSRYGVVRSGGDVAITDFRVIEKFFGHEWWEATPRTGRTHQIRVHAEHLGCPILGDLVYFPKDVRPLVQAPRLMLHAISLKFQHPISGKEIFVESTLPSAFLNLMQSFKAKS